MTINNSTLTFLAPKERGVEAIKCLKKAPGEPHRYLSRTRLHTSFIAYKFDIEPKTRDTLKNKLLYISLLLTLLFGGEAFAQINLVPNPSFEVHDSCPDTYGQISFAVPWYHPTNGTSDYYNVCFDSALSPWSFGYDIPQNYIGYQYAKQGVAYAGIIVADPYPFDTTVEYRDYIQTKLLSPLQTNEIYSVSFWVSLADSSNNATDAIGLYFSKDSLTGYVTTSETSFLNVVPQIQNPAGNIIGDKINWTLISGQYIAAGGEQYITISNFKKNGATTIQHLSNGGNIHADGDYIYSYYYVDVVSVISTDSIVSLLVPNVFTPNGDHVNDTFTFSGINFAAFNCKIYDRWGILTYEWNDGLAGWDGATKSGEQMPTGVYYFVLTATATNTVTYNRKGFIQLIR